MDSLFGERKPHIGLSILVLLPIVTLIFALLRLTRAKKDNYPPGPKGVPLLGNIPQLPQDYPGLKFEEWGKQYGDMFTIFMGNTRWVVLNNSKLVRDILDRRGRLYISRPPFPVTQDILSNGNRIVLMQHTERWRNIRKVMHQILMAKQTQTYKPYQDIESRKLLWDYLHRPDEYYLHGARFANSVIFSVVFGRRTSMSEESVKRLFSTIDDFLGQQTSPSANLIDGFPSLAKILPKPLQWYRPAAERIFKKTISTYGSFFDDLEKRIGNGEDPQCFAREVINLSGAYGFDSDQIYFIAGSLIEAGSDTTRNQINLMVAAAAKFPRWVKKAREELDAVCGKAGRLPTFEDWDSLPYIVAAVKETLRWRPNMIATGVPRVLVEDDTIGKYKFEKGTVFTWNQFGISHNEKEYPDNETFKPERFLNEDLQDMLKGHWGFGMGRRVCPGWHLGSQNMFITFSRLLYCFDFAEDPAEPIDVRRINPLAHSSAPYKVIITPRSKAHIALIEKECSEAGTQVD